MKCSVALVEAHLDDLHSFSNSTVKAHDSQEYRNMEMNRISFTFDPRDMLLPLQIGFSFVRAAVAGTNLERISGFEPSSETAAPRYLKLVTVPSFDLSGCHRRSLSSFWSSQH